MSKTDDPQTIAPMENPAETMRKVMTELGVTEQIHHPAIKNILTQPLLVSLPQGRKVEDLTSHMRTAAEFLKPARRKGTAKMKDMDSFIAWSTRFKGETSALFANPSRDAPSITCIADYHGAGPVDLAAQGDPTARHCHHRAVYDFPLSDEWKAWTGISGKGLDKDEMGEFIEANAKDIFDPSPALISGKEEDAAHDWEKRLIQTARQIEGRYGQLHQLLQMSRHFQVNETSNLSVTTNRDTGEAQIQFLNEHKDAEGAPLKVPNLIIIAIPVFRNSAPYRMPVRFRYRKSGSAVKFILSLYNPDKAFDAAFDEAVALATEATDLPTFHGTPEA